MKGGVKIENSIKLPIRGEWAVNLYARMEDGRSEKLCLQNVKYVPGLYCHQIPVPQLTEKGVFVMFGNQVTVGTLNGEVISNTRKAGKMYELCSGNHPLHGPANSPATLCMETT